MSTKKESEKTTTRVSEDDKFVETRTGSGQPSISDQQYSVNRVLDETKDNIKRGIEEARREVPRNTQAINDYQEQHLRAAQEIADSYLDSQKDIINSFQSAWAPHLENYFDIWNSWASPRRATEVYARAVSNFADNLITTTRIANNAMIANMEAFRTYVERRKHDSREYSRLGASTARTYAQTSRDIANDMDRGSSSTSRNY